MSEFSEFTPDEQVWRAAENAERPLIGDGIRPWLQAFGEVTINSFDPELIERFKRGDGRPNGTDTARELRTFFEGNDQQ